VVEFVKIPEGTDVLSDVWRVNEKVGVLLGRQEMVHLVVFLLQDLDALAQLGDFGIPVFKQLFERFEPSKQVHAVLFRDVRVSGVFKVARVDSEVVLLDRRQQLWLGVGLGGEGLVALGAVLRGHVDVYE